MHIGLQTEALDAKLLSAVRLRETLTEAPPPPLGVHDKELYSATSIPILVEDTYVCRTLACVMWSTLAHACVCGCVQVCASSCGGSARTSTAIHNRAIACCCWCKPHTHLARATPTGTCPRLRGSTTLHRRAARPAITTCSTSTSQRQRQRQWYW